MTARNADSPSPPSTHPVVGRPRLARLAIAALVAANVVICVFAFTPILRVPVARWVRSDALPPQAVDAVVVLGGGHSADRLLEGIRQVRLRHAALLLSTRLGMSGTPS